MHDSHIHLSLSPIRENLKRIITDFKEENGKYILDMGTEPDDWTTVLNTRQNRENSKTIFSGIGIHPTIYEENISILGTGVHLFKSSQIFLNKLENFYEEYHEEINVIGETGLDYFQMYKRADIPDNVKDDLKEIQKNSFRKHCQLALKYNLPMSIHSRELNGKSECVKDTLKILAEEGKGNIRGSFHSYTGTKEGLEEILNLGFYVGFNAIITYPSGENVRGLLKAIPLDKILFETDGPFLPTQKTRKKHKSEFPFGKPSDIKEIIEAATEIKDIPYERLEKETDKNFELLFNISPN